MDTGVRINFIEQDVIMPLYLLDLQAIRLTGVRSITTIFSGAGTRSSQALHDAFSTTRMLVNAKADAASPVGE